MFVEAPQLAAIPPELTAPCDAPVGLKSSMTTGQQVTAWAKDRASLVACKERHGGLVSLVTTERNALKGPR